jgi:hypothetical protein
LYSSSDHQFLSNFKILLKLLAFSQNAHFPNNCVFLFKSGRKIERGIGKGNTKEKKQPMRKQSRVDGKSFQTGAASVR